MIRVHPIKESTGYALAKVCKAHRGNVGEYLAEVGLHVGQEMVLIELIEQNGLRGGDLAERLGVEPPTVTKMLRRPREVRPRGAPPGFAGRQELPRVPHRRRTLARRAARPVLGEG